MQIVNPFSNPEKVIGICGGGQLGKMLCEAASEWDWKTAVLDESKDFPAGKIAHHFVEGDFTKYEDVLAFGKTVDVLTIEFSSVPVEESDEEKPGIILDYDKDGNIVGLEILNASKRMENPRTLEYAVA